MANYKIPNEGEAVRWIAEGKTYREIVALIEDKYGVRVGISSLSDLRARKGIPPRHVREDTLIPWAVKEEHARLYPQQMLRNLARRRAGLPLTEIMSRKLDAWVRDRMADNTVVHYDPDTPEGWFYVPRREGIDNNYIREPDKITKRKRAREFFPGP